ncbi:MAG: reverse transcriptase domain-containing protein [Candidatus Paceibacterota bacterium]
MGSNFVRGGGDSLVTSTHSYNNIISVENLLAAWQEFLRGKRKKHDVQKFGRNLMDNVLALHRDLKNKTYQHGPYHAFNISDPKPRNIHKASVRDRLLHHAIHRRLYPFFDKKFISGSYSCRVNKGTHKALNRFRAYAHSVSKNHTRTVWVLKCDIRKFFASVDQKILLDIVARHIHNSDTVLLINQIVSSFNSDKSGKGLPLGNLTSQLLVNIYMNEFDHFTKHKLKAKYYVRYADDFVILSRDKEWLVSLIPRISDFLESKLALSLHPDKVYIKSFASGVDFLGWIHFPDHRVLRTVAKRKMLRVIEEKKDQEETVQSYIGLLSHGNCWKLKQRICAKTA